MRGGFSFMFSADKGIPRIQVKHLGRRAALIQFTKPAQQDTPRGMRKRGMTVQPHRGFFVDVKTIIAALTGSSHTLKSAADLLGVPNPKLETADHGETLTEAYIDYACRDVLTTWECFAELRDRYGGHGLTETPLPLIYSEASIGKAYLRQMGVRPWREVQADFPDSILGHIMSTYYGGRAEVHLRRDIAQVIYCDFLSMYPTVCTLMGLWRFVIAESMDWHDDTEGVRHLLETVGLADLRLSDVSAFGTN